MTAEAPSETAPAAHATVLEILKLLNRAEEEERDVVGLELRDLEREMEHFWTVASGESNLPSDLALLVSNGLVRTESGAVYSWERNRTVGERFRITTEGKTYLLSQLQESGRIG